MFKGALFQMLKTCTINVIKFFRIFNRIMPPKIANWKFNLHQVQNSRVGKVYGLYLYLAHNIGIIIIIETRHKQ